MRSSDARSLAILHPAFLMTGVLHASGGPLLPSLAATFALSDSQAGLLFFVYFAGTSIGALLCTGHYSRLMAAGFALVAVSCTAVTVARLPWSLLAFAAMGIGVGLPMSAVSLFVGRRWSAGSAPTLVFLNFTWSIGALTAPLLAARILTHHGFQTAYAGLAAASVVAAIACWLLLSDEPDIPAATSAAAEPAVRSAIAIFAIAAFLEVGVESTAAAWLTTYVMRTVHSSPAVAASLSALYWTGFLVSRAGSSLILLRVQANHLLRILVPAAFCAALLLVGTRSQSVGEAAMFLLGAACAPVYPLIVVDSFSNLQRVSQTRWVLAAAGVGGSILPWLTGSISSRSGDIRLGVLTLPAALLVMLCLLPRITRNTATISRRA